MHKARSINDLIDNGLVESDSRQRLIEADWALHALREARAVLQKLCSLDPLVWNSDRAVKLLKKWDK